MHRDPDNAIANPGEAEFHLPGHGEEIRAVGLYSMWAGAYHSTRVYVWADSFESAFEVVGQYEFVAGFA